jgi:hypothetical protein
MAFKINTLNEGEFTIEGLRVHKNGNGDWICTPPSDNEGIQKAIIRHIEALEKL